VSGLLESVLTAPPALVYLVVAALVFAEDAFFVGFVIPGETAAILGGGGPPPPPPAGARPGGAG
jgi:membrane-associated protein